MSWGKINDLENQISELRREILEEKKNLQLTCSDCESKNKVRTTKLTEKYCYEYGDWILSGNFWECKKCKTQNFLDPKLGLWPSCFKKHEKRES